MNGLKLNKSGLRLGQKNIFLHSFWLRIISCGRSDVILTNIYICIHSFITTKWWVRGSARALPFLEGSGSTFFEGPRLDFLRRAQKLELEARQCSGSTFSEGPKLGPGSSSTFKARARLELDFQSSGSARASLFRARPITNYNDLAMVTYTHWMLFELWHIEIHSFSQKKTVSVKGRSIGISRRKFLSNYCLLITYKLKYIDCNNWVEVFDSWGWTFHVLCKYIFFLLYIPIFIFRN